MSDIDLEPVYTAIKYRLKTTGLNAYDHVPGSTEWPGAFILPPDVELEGLSDGWVTVRFEIVVLVSAALDVHQLNLLPYQNLTGAKSIPAAFKADPTLGGLVGDIRVVRSRPLHYEEQAGYQGFGCAFETVARIG